VVRRIPRSVVIGLAVFALVILPFVLWGDRFDAWAHALLDHEPRGLMPPLICIALLAGDVVLPVPSSLVSTAAGYWWGLWGGALVVMLGMTLGSWLGYVLGAKASGLRRWMGEGEAERMHRLFARHGEWIVVMLRPVPVLAEASAVFRRLQPHGAADAMQSCRSPRTPVSRCSTGRGRAARQERTRREPVRATRRARRGDVRRAAAAARCRRELTRRVSASPAPP
jgi:hypothetical protein